MRLSGLFNCIVFSDLSETDVEAQVAAVVADLQSTGGHLEWKVHGHDRPPTLASVLQRYGFTAEPEETLLVREIDEAFLSLPVNDEVAIKAVSTKEDAADFLAATDAAFGEPFAHDVDHFLGQIEAGEAALHVAYLAGAPVAAGRLEMPVGRTFAGLYTGGVSPAHRGRGVYRALVRSRAQAAAQKGYRYLVTEALPTSRPILERLGFEPLTTVQGWVLGAGGLAEAGG